MLKKPVYQCDNLTVFTDLIQVNVNRNVNVKFVFALIYLSYVFFLY